MDACRDRCAGKGRPVGEDVEVEEERHRPRGHHQYLRRRHRALVHAVGQPAGTRPGLDRIRHHRRLAFREPGAADTLPPAGTAPEADAAELRRATHAAIAGVTADLEAFHFNRAVARVHELANTLSDADPATAGGALREGLETITLLIGPMMPHLAEELWHMLGHDTLVADTPWPAADESLLVEDSMKIAVQVRGKMRGTIEVPTDAEQPLIEEKALGLPTVIAALDGAEIKKVIYVPNRIINLIH